MTITEGDLADFERRVSIEQLAQAWDEGHRTTTDENPYRL